MECIFASDLHGRKERYDALFRSIGEIAPQAVFLGGDLLPRTGDVVLFIEEMMDRIDELRSSSSPCEVYVILGNDDPKQYEGEFIRADREGKIHYAHQRRFELGGYVIRGYSHVPPSPFLLKDWEKYDVSRYVDPGCVPPEEGIFTTDVDRGAIPHTTIKGDLSPLIRDPDMHRTIMLFHAPPYGTSLDMANIGGKMIDHVPLDPHVGSIAIKEFIESASPLLTLHGHIHESATLTGSWREEIGKTTCLSAAYEGKGLALVRFDTEQLGSATRGIIS
ncbi:MAG: hypothetical protein QCI82_09575 [Candidatus Thermoplasmatota archaeon]|nr:hypothetical protein [Candidatus Thermoplasmatota archaeon]